MERQTGPCFVGVAASRLLQSLIYVQPQLKLIWVKVSWLRAHWGSPGPGPGPCAFKCHIISIQLCAELWLPLEDASQVLPTLPFLGWLQTFPSLDPEHVTLQGKGLGGFVPLKAA